jgi:hypothetical protein
MEIESTRSHMNLTRAGLFGFVIKLFALVWFMEFGLGLLLNIVAHNATMAFGLIELRDDQEIDFKVIDLAVLVCPFVLFLISDWLAHLISGNKITQLDVGLNGREILEITIKLFGIWLVVEALIALPTIVEAVLVVSGAQASTQTYSGGVENVRMVVACIGHGIRFFCGLGLVRYSDKIVRYFKLA